MPRYAGLTDDPQRRKAEHGSPVDWQAFGPFATERQARDWEAGLHRQGYLGDGGGAGWKYGYTYSVNSGTRE
jgi:hypothetical protein